MEEESGTEIEVEARQTDATLNESNAAEHVAQGLIVNLKEYSESHGGKGIVGSMPTSEYESKKQDIKHSLKRKHD